MSKLEQARQLVSRASIPRELARMGEDEIGNYAVDEARLLYFNGDRTLFLTEEVSPTVLAASLAYTIELNTEEVTDEHAVPLGVSKYKGLPHLPAGMTWPEGQYFLAQINLAELRPHDVEGIFPKEGMLFFFVSPSEDCTVLFHDGPSSALQLTPYPEASLPGAEYYLDDFVAGSALISFEPGYLFYLGGDAYDHSEVSRLIPEELRDRLDDLLGCGLRDSDTSLRIFGRPLYWQGEDETWPDEEEDQGEGESEVVIFQDEFGEGHVHYWAKPSDIRTGDFSKVWVDYSGT